MQHNKFVHVLVSFMNNICVIQFVLVYFEQHLCSFCFSFFRTIFVFIVFLLWTPFCASCVHVLFYGHPMRHFPSFFFVVFVSWTIDHSYVWVHPHVDSLCAVVDTFWVHTHVDSLCAVVLCLSSYSCWQPVCRVYVWVHTYVDSLCVVALYVWVLMSTAYVSLF